MQVHMQISALEQLADVTEYLLEQLGWWQISEEKQMDIRLCLMEAVQNALLYGCPADGQPAEVQISWRCSKQGFVFTVADNGPGVPEYLRCRSWDTLPLEEHGRGILLLQAILDEVQFNEAGNCITGRINW